MTTPSTSAALLAAAATALTLAAACGSQQAIGQPVPGPRTALTIAVRPNAHAAVQHWTLRCDPTGGTLPGRAAACATLARVSAPFAPVKRGLMCSMIYGGPQTATIKGTWHGTHVQAAFARTDGCQTAHWNKIAPVFGPYANPTAATG